MKTINKILPIALLSPLTVISASVSAAGFQLAEYSATGLGRAYAGEAAIADNAASQWRNPALLSQLEGTQISAGGIYVDPNVDVDGTYTGAGSVAASSDDYVDGAIIPNLYLSHKVTSRWALGLAAGTNYGMNSDLGDDFLASSMGNTAEIITSELNLNLAYLVTDRISVGGGIRYVMAEGSFGSTLPGTDTIMGYVEGDTEEWGWQIGAIWNINNKNSIGLTYKSEIDLDLEGTAEHIMVAGGDTGSLQLTLPATAEIAYALIANERLGLSASINWTDWSTFEELDARLDNYDLSIYKYEGWDDSYRFSLGAEYQLSPKWLLRSGFAYDMSAVDDENRTATIPETSRYWMTFGAGFAPNDKLTVDAGLAYILSEDAELDDESALGDSYSAETSGSVIVAGIQASYKF